MRRIGLEALRLAAQRKPKGYLEDVVASGTVDGDELLMEEEPYQRLRAKWTTGGARLDQIEPPTILEKAKNFAAATARWLSAGVPVVTEAEEKLRRHKCQHECPVKAWSTDGLYDHCALCGCGGLKLEWATEECPLPGVQKQWAATVPQRARSAAAGPLQSP